MIKRVWLIILLFCLLPNLYGQRQYLKSFELSWQDKQVFEIDLHQSISLPFVYADQINYNEHLPYFNSTWQIPHGATINTSKITTVSYQILTKEQYGDLNTEYISSNILYNLTTNKANGITNAHLYLTPLIKVDGVVKKVTGFTIEYTLTTPKKTVKSPPITSVLSEGEWFKFAVDTTGVFKINRSFLNDLGINTNQIDPRNIQIFGNGGGLLPYKIGDFRYEDLQENAVYVYGEADGNFDTDDYILFYARGPESWTHYNTKESVKHIKNIYDDYAYYFIHISDNQGKRIADATPVNGNSTITYSTYNYFWVHEIDQYNLFQTGQQFLGHKFDNTTTYNLGYTFDNLNTNTPVQINIKAIGQSLSTSSMSLKVNDIDLKTIDFGNTNHPVLAREGESINVVNINNETLDFEFIYDKNGNSSAVAYLDYIEVIGEKNLIANNKQFVFRQFDQVNQTGIVSFEIQNANNIFQLWNISDPINPTLMSNESTSGTFQFSGLGGVLSEYCVLNSQDFYSPILLDRSKVDNQNIHSITQTDYLIITHESLVNKAEDLAQFHRTNNNLDVEVVPLYKIYNEFASGSQDITAIRDFIKYVYDQSEGQLKYVLMYGDASFDFKGIQSETGLVPAFQSYKSFNMTESFVTDDYYVIVSDDNEGDLDNDLIQIQDIAISRLPINTISEAEAVNNKIINYYKTETFGDWRNNILMIADDSDKSGEDIMQKSQESLSSIIKENKPQVNIKKLWLDAFQQETVAGGSRYPDVNHAINENIEKGVSFIDYFGHGGESGLAQERIVEANQIRSWENLDKLNLFIVISCEFARFDNPLRPDTAGEILIRHSQGGSVHEIATSREIFISLGNYFNSLLIPNLLAFDNTYHSIAENLMLAKNKSLNKQRYFITSFGDPSMHLSIPKPDIKLTQMNGQPINQNLDSIKGLSLTSFNGIITDKDGTKDTSFNGELILTVFDKSMKRQTLNNDGVADIMTFDTQDSKLFRGKAQVENGDFYIEFIAPKDLRMAYGEGKLSFYAQSDDNEKGGYNTDVVIGGIDTSAPEDNEGPIINLYMNDTHFVDGGKTDESPLFLAFIKDEHGINTSLSSVDHDIVAVLDDNYQNPIILNEYFITNLNDFTQGEIKYRLSELESGPHSITLTAYDTYNNASSATLNFVVKDNTELEITSLMNYPNPFSENTTIVFNHNRINQYLDVEFQVFTMAGQMIKYSNQTIFATTKTSKDIIWDGLDSNGYRISKGIYLYRIGLTDPIMGTQTEAYNKMIILE